MNEKFGQFDWKCWKDEKPDEDMPIYAYREDIVSDVVSVGYEGDFHMNDNTYWCYVFIPDAPKIEKNMNERIGRLEHRLQSLIDRLNLGNI